MMDNSINYKSLLPGNIDFLDSESTAQNSISPDVNTEIVGGSPLEPNTKPSPETPKNPDREKLIGSLGERIDSFFGMAKIRGVHIIESAGEIKRSGTNLEDMAGQGRHLTNTVREISDPRAGEISDLIAQTARRANENADDIRRSIGELHVDDQIGFIKGQEREFVGQGMDEYQQELRDALDIEDPDERSAKLEELKSRVISFAIRIDQTAGEGFHKSLSLKDRAENGTVSIPGRLDSVHDMLPRLREKMGDSYYRAVNMVQEMGDSYSRFRRGFEHMDSLPLEFRILSNAANELGVGINEIFDAFAEGEYT